MGTASNWYPAYPAHYQLFTADAFSTSYVFVTRKKKHAKTKTLEAINEYSKSYGVARRPTATKLAKNIITSGKRDTIAKWAHLNKSSPPLDVTSVLGVVECPSMP